MYRSRNLEVQDWAAVGKTFPHKKTEGTDAPGDSLNQLEKGKPFSPGKQTTH